jgi:hypothetical protein
MMMENVSFLSLALSTLGFMLAMIAGCAEAFWP